LPHEDTLLELAKDLITLCIHTSKPSVQLPQLPCLVQLQLV